VSYSSGKRRRGLIAQRSTLLGHPMHVRAVGSLPTPSATAMPYLAVTDSYDDPQIAAAEAAARSVGHDAAASDLGCDVGAAEALGRTAPVGAAVAVCFESQEHATLARATFERYGTPVVGVADVSFICVD
jgi:hypothetical protein